MYSRHSGCGCPNCGCPSCPSSELGLKLADAKEKIIRLRELQSLIDDYCENDKSFPSSDESSTMDRLRYIIDKANCNSSLLESTSTISMLREQLQNRTENIKNLEESMHELQFSYKKLVQRLDEDNTDTSQKYYSPSICISPDPILNARTSLVKERIAEWMERVDNNQTEFIHKKLSTPMLPPIERPRSFSNISHGKVPKVLIPIIEQPKTNSNQMNNNTNTNDTNNHHYQLNENIREKTTIPKKNKHYENSNNDEEDERLDCSLNDFL